MRTMPRSGAALLLAALALPLTACDEEAPPPVTPPAPEIGMMDIPISLRHDPRAPANALTIAINHEGIGIGDERIVGLENGLVTADERTAGGVIPSLRAAIQRAPASAAAIIRAGALVPYGTVARVIATLEASNIRTFAFTVRVNNGESAEYMEFGQFATRPRADAYYRFDPPYQHGWDEFVGLWDEMRNACMGPNAGDCLQRLTTPPTGGFAQVGIFTRGQALQLTVQRFTEAELNGEVEPEPEPTPEEADTDISNEELMRLDPQKSASFMWRFPAALMEEGSPITATVSPLCGQGCGIVITAEEPTPIMRTIGFLGAAFPNGTGAPALLFEVPDR